MPSLRGKDGPEDRQKGAMVVELREATMGLQGAAGDPAKAEAEKAGGDLMLYPVIIVNNGAWHLSFPDFPGLALMQIGTLGKLLRSARQVLQEKIDELKDEGEVIPEPTRVDDLILGEGMVLGRVSVVVSEG